VLKGNTHPLELPEFDLGTAPATVPMQRMLLVLKRSPELPEFSKMCASCDMQVSAGKTRNEIIRVGVLPFSIAARFANLAVSLPQYQFASHRKLIRNNLHAHG
jgi:hypothetical protein